ncbi:hypothetical protein GCM10009687_22550 [Asanoa iriomotensis]|uniref:Uncharacterized protein n=1 Tax=Asanoa iriomotensis TaxID=234613 RepID=A0ABQ4CGB8_9ACTN|nr:hypothetical protein Air01nite_74550 [Asanoa iriomotensis]
MAVGQVFGGGPADMAWLARVDRRGEQPMRRDWKSREPIEPAWISVARASICGNQRMTPNKLDHLGKHTAEISQWTVARGPAPESTKGM